MTDQEQIQQLRTNLQAALILNNINRAKAQTSSRQAVTGFLGRIKSFFSK